jgi:aryl-alcohol dehydrogenase-like predicted oxidoreductase
MKYRNLGRTGLKVSPLCLGTMIFGSEVDAATATRIIGKARDRGINMIDTANVYNHGVSEEIIGAAIASDRDKWVVASKTRSKMGPGPNEQGLSRKQIMTSIEGTLRRLKTDYLDIYYMHKQDFETPLSEAVHAMADLVRQGKIRYFGVSNFRAWRIADICRTCDELGLDRPAVSSPLYNIVNRQAEVEELPVCGHYGVGVISYSPLARSVLSGAYTLGEEPAPGTRAHRKDFRLMEQEWRPESLQIAETLKGRAKELGITLAQFAVAWILNNRLVTGVVAGPAEEAHLDDYLAALDHRFTAEDEALVESLVATGSQSTLGHIDPLHPIEGRQARTIISE